VVLLLSLFFSVVGIISCKDENSIITPADGDGNEINIQEEINSIIWDKLIGRAVYIKKDKYLLMDTKNRSVKIIGEADSYIFTNVKINHDKTLLTLMIPDSTNEKVYNLMAIDFNGNKSRLCPQLEFDTEFYD
jgi:hypothetical protein